jgi:hypothetical protein
MRTTDEQQANATFVGYAVAIGVAIALEVA